MKKALRWVPAALLGAMLGCSVSSHKSADEMAGAGLPPNRPNTPHDPAPPAPPPMAAAPAQPPALPPEHAAVGEGAPEVDPGLSGVQVRFGIMPGDYADVEEGVLIGEVFEGTPAEKGGLRAGDRMTRWNGQHLTDVEGWMPFLGAGKPGDVVTVTYLRDGQQKTTQVTLEAR